MSVFSLTDYSREPRTAAEELVISTEQDLREALKRFQQHDPGFVDLCSPAGDCLSIGVGGPLACLMFIRASGDPPYLWALGNSDDREHTIEFSRGGTPTPISLYRCLPFENALEIAVYYFQHERLPESVQWDKD